MNHSIISFGNTENNENSSHQKSDSNPFTLRLNEENEVEYQKVETITFNSQSQSEKVWRNSIPKKTKISWSFIKNTFCEEQQLHKYDKSNNKTSSMISSNYNNNTSIKWNATLSLTSKEVFWNKEIVKYVWNRLNHIKNRVWEKKKNDYDYITHCIEIGDDEKVFNILSENDFIKFYLGKDSLFPNNVFMETMIENHRFELLCRVITIPQYQFNYDYIFTLIEKNLVQNKDENSFMFSSIAEENNNNNNKKLNKYNQKTIYYNLIKNRLYSREEENVKIIGWFFAQFDYYYDIFYLLVQENKCYETEWKKYNKFATNEDVAALGNDDSYFLKVIEYCLKKQYENIAICYCEHINWIHDLDALAILAASKQSWTFWKYLWEKDLYKDQLTKGKIIPSKTNSNLLLKPQSFSNSWSKNTNTKLLIPIGTKTLSNANIYSHKPNFNPLPSRELETDNNNKYNNNIINTHTYLNTNNQWLLSRRTISKKCNEFAPNFTLSPVIKKLVKNNPQLSTRNSNLNGYIYKMLTWANIEKDPSFISSLFHYGCFEQIGILWSKWDDKQFSNPVYFKICILKKESELIIYYLRKGKLIYILADQTIQEYIVYNYTQWGDKWYYAAEMLMYIYKNNWKREWTKDLCKNIRKTIKTKDIMNCHSPILTCLLLCEFLEKVKNLVTSNIRLCEKVMYELKEYCKTIQECINSESYISYLMKQKDTQGRSAFQIISENSWYHLLETPEIGTIIKKMWDGKLNNNGFNVASSMYRFILNHEKRSCDPFISFDSLDINKVYFFQLTVWWDSCSLRLYPVGWETMLVVAIYNLFIYQVNLDSQLLNNFKELNRTSQILFTAYLFFATTGAIDLFLKIYFAYKTKRQFKIKIWNFIDILVFLLAWLAWCDTREWTNEYKSSDLNSVVKNWIWDLQIQLTKEVNQEIVDYSSSRSFIERVIILSLSTLLVWIRLAGVLWTYKQMGPVLRMIMSMAILLVKYIIIIAIFLVGCSSIFTLFFSKDHVQFGSFSESILTLFGCFLNNFDLKNSMKNIIMSVQ